jgi:hypothetical protein
MGKSLPDFVQNASHFVRQNYSMSSNIVYSVCKQTATEHVHYELRLLNPSEFATTLDVLRRLANVVGGQTAGQVILHLQDKINDGFDLNVYGIDYLKIVTIPLHQLCYKAETTSSIDWDEWLFITPYPDVPPEPTHPPYVGRITH